MLETVVGGERGDVFEREILLAEHCARGPRMRPLAFLIVLSLGCTTKATVGDSSTEPPTHDPADETPEVEPPGWTVDEGEAETSEDDLVSRLPDGVIVHTEPATKDDIDIDQVLFLDPRFWSLDITTGASRLGKIDDPEFERFWKSFDRSETYLELLDPFPGLSDAHAFRCDLRGGYYLVTEGVLFHCGGEVYFITRESSGGFVNPEVDDWLDDLRSLDVGTQASPFTFTVVGRAQVFSTQRVFQILANPQSGRKYPVITVPND